MAILAVGGFGAGTLFQRQVGVGTLLILLGVKQAPANVALAARLASLDTRPVPDNRIIFTGDSLIEYHEWSEAFSAHPIINRGVAGAKIPDITGRYDLSKATALFSLIGINDLGDGADLAEFKARYKKYLISIPPDIAFFAVSLPCVTRYINRNIDPLLIEHCNDFIRGQALGRAGTYIDIYHPSRDGGRAFFVSDGIHFSAEGYRTVIAILKPHVERASSQHMRSHAPQTSRTG